MRFRFESLLRLRKNEENLVQKDMARINAHLIDQQEKLENLAEVRQESKSHFDQMRKQNPEANLMQLYDDFFQSAKSQGIQQKQIISETEERAAAKRQELAEAMKKRRTFEILQERELLAFKKEQLRRETQFFDEVASSRWKGEER